MKTKKPVRRPSASTPISSSLSGRPSFQIEPLEGRSCNGAELLALLTRLPRPDEEYLAAVEAVTLSQSVVERSSWEK